MEIAVFVLRLDKVQLSELVTVGDLNGVSLMKLILEFYDGSTFPRAPCLYYLHWAPTSINMPNVGPFGALGIRNMY